MEDVELNRRIVKAGIRSLFLPSAQVKHPWRRRVHRHRAGPVKAGRPRHLCRRCHLAGSGAITEQYYAPALQEAGKHKSLKVMALRARALRKTTGLHPRRGQSNGGCSPNSRSAAGGWAVPPLLPRPADHQGVGGRRRARCPHFLSLCRGRRVQLAGCIRILFSEAAQPGRCAARSGSAPPRSELLVVRSDIVVGDLLAEPLSLLCPHYQFWKSWGRRISARVQS